MQVLDLKRNSRIKATAIIDREYGGRVKFKDAVRKGGIGIGKLMYQGGLKEVDDQKEEGKFYKSNIEIYHDGIGFYMYNVDDNFLVLLKANEVEQFVISKPLDVIRPANFSFFAKMKEWGMDYYKCRYMLLEQEIMEYHELTLATHLADDQIMNFIIKRNSPYKHQDFFADNALGIPYKEEIHGHLVLD